MVVFEAWLWFRPSTIGVICTYVVTLIFGPFIAIRYYQTNDSLLSAFHSVFFFLFVCVCALACMYLLFANSKGFTLQGSTPRWLIWTTVEVHLYLFVDIAGGSLISAATHLSGRHSVHLLYLNYFSSRCVDSNSGLPTSAHHPAQTCGNTTLLRTSILADTRCLSRLKAKNSGEAATRFLIQCICPRASTCQTCY